MLHLCGCSCSNVIRNVESLKYIQRIVCILDRNKTFKYSKEISKTSQARSLSNLSNLLKVYSKPTKLTNSQNFGRDFHRGTVLFSDKTTMAENRYLVGYAKLGTSSCKKCKQKIEKGALRIAKLVSNPFSDEGGDMKQWYHPACIFETFVRARATTKKIEDPDDLEGFSDLQQEDKDTILKLIKDFQDKQGSPAGKKKTPAKAKTPAKKDVKPEIKSEPVSASDQMPSTSKTEVKASVKTEDSKDDSFREFRRLCADIAEENSYTGKTSIIKKFITKGSSGDGYTGDLYLLMKLLLPGVVKSVYNLNNKQLVKLYSQVFGTSQKEMLEDLDQGDVAETVRIFFEKSHKLPPKKKCQLTIIEVNDLLEQLSKVTKENDQERILTKIAKQCTANDLKMVIRLIKHDLRINSGAKHILDALDPNAYAAFQTSRDLRDVVERVQSNKEGGQPGMSKKLSVKANLMTPVLPMLAEACRSVNQAMKKCPQGFYAEIKYDGERVQLHKKGGDFQYFSRSLKPVLPHKVSHFKEYIPKAFPSGDDLILDAEVLLIDTTTGVPLPFGTLGKHKKEQFKDANVCLFIFDCLHINGENIMNKPIKERRKILEKNMTEVENRVKFSEMKFIDDPDELTDMMNRVFQDGLEGLVLKDINSHYEPGKRHWLKVKKDYLNEGQMADSADLVVLGGYYGTGNKGGMMSVFLTGVYDPASKLWCTVTKVGGFDDATLEKLQTEMDMIKISKNMTKVPDWLDINKNLVPDFIVRDPKQSPVWEVAGAEFSKSQGHTADGISIRFPRVMKVRDDKSWKEATDLPRLKELYEKSKDTSDLVIPGTKGKGGKGKTPTKKQKSTDGEDSDNGTKGKGGKGKTPTKKQKLTDGEDSDSGTKGKGGKGKTPTKKQKLTDGEDSDNGTKGKGRKGKTSTKKQKSTSGEDSDNVRKPLDTSDLVIHGTEGKDGKGKTRTKKQKLTDGEDSDNGNENSNGFTKNSKPASTPSKPSKTPTKQSSTSTNSPSIMKYFSPKKESVDSTPSKATKRPSENGDHSTPTKKSKAECKYGTDCYQKSPAHTDKFSHPPKIPQQSNNGLLPNVFTGAKIYLPEDIPDYKKLKRYIIAFDGEVVKEFNKGTATHSVVPTDYKGPPEKCEGVCIKVSWLWTCIKQKLLKSTHGFIINS